MKLLREFINMNINVMYDLQRCANINALKDIVSGPGLSFKVNDQNVFKVDEDDLKHNESTSQLGLTYVEIDELDDDPVLFKKR